LQTFGFTHLKNPTLLCRVSQAKNIWSYFICQAMGTKWTVWGSI